MTLRKALGFGLLATLLLTVLSGLTFAQQPDPQLPDLVIAAGIGYNQNPQIFGWVGLGKRIAGNVYNYSGFDAKPIPGQTLPLGKLQVPKLQLTFLEGIMYPAVRINKLTLWTRAAGGIAADGQSTVGSVNLGTSVTHPLGKGWGAMVDGSWDHNSISNSDWCLRIGFTYSSFSK